MCVCIHVCVCTSDRINLKTFQSVGESHVAQTKGWLSVADQVGFFPVFILFEFVDEIFVFLQAVLWKLSFLDVSTHCYLKNFSWLILSIIYLWSSLAGQKYVGRAYRGELSSEAHICPVNYLSIWTMSIHWRRQKPAGIELNEGKEETLLLIPPTHQTFALINRQSLLLTG